MPRFTAESLKARGLEIISILTTTNDFSAMATVLSPKMEALHEDGPAVVGRENFLSHWKVLLESVPDLSAEVYDTVAEVNAGGAGGKVWIFSRINGLPDGVRKDSVDMLEIDGEGLLVRIRDVQRVVGV